MNFDLDDEQQEIKRTAHEFLGDRFKPEKVRELAESRSYDEGLWKQVSELGWPGIAIAEEDGGQGLGMVEQAVLLEQSGYACAPTPLLGNAGAAPAISGLRGGGGTARGDGRPPLLRRGGGARRRAAPRRRRRGPRPDRRGDLRGAHRDRPAGDGDGRRLRAGAPAVRAPDR